MSKRVKTAAVALVLLLARATAAADPEPAHRHVETEEPRLLCVPPQPPERCITLPPGHFVDAATWSALDAAIRAAEDRATRFDAQNKVLREAASGSQPGWRTLALAVLTGIAGGWYLHDKL